MKANTILCLTLLTGCVTAQQNADTAARDKLVGSWQSAPDDVDSPVIINYHADGTFDFEIKEHRIACQGTWAMADGHFEDQVQKSEQCPLGGRQTRDKVVSIDEHDYFARAEDGILLHSERVEPIRPPQATDTFDPKFAWSDQGQVPVREKILIENHQFITEGLISWSRNQDKWLFQVDHPRLIVENKQATDQQMFPGKKSQHEVDANGRFLGVIDWKNDPTYLITPMGPKPWDGPQAEATTRQGVERFWAERVQLWSAITIKNGKAAWKPDSAKILPKFFNPDKFQVEYKGRCSRSPQCVVLEVSGTLESTEAYLAYFAYRLNQAGTYEDQFRYRVEIDFATLRPFKVSVYERLSINWPQGSKTANSEYHRFYDWKKSQ